MQHCLKVLICGAIVLVPCLMMPTVWVAIISQHYSHHLSHEAIKANLDPSPSLPSPSADTPRCQLLLCSAVPGSNCAAESDKTAANSHLILIWSGSQRPSPHLTYVRSTWTKMCIYSHICTFEVMLQLWIKCRRQYKVMNKNTPEAMIKICLNRSQVLQQCFHSKIIIWSNGE